MRDVTRKLFKTAWMSAYTVALAVIALLAPQLGAARAGCISEGSWVTVNCWVHGELVTDTWQGHTISWDRWARTPDEWAVRTSDLRLQLAAERRPDPHRHESARRSTRLLLVGRLRPCRDLIGWRPGDLHPRHDDAAASPPAKRDGHRPDIPRLVRRANRLARSLANLDGHRVNRKRNGCPGDLRPHPLVNRARRTVLPQWVECPFCRAAVLDHRGQVAGGRWLRSGGGCWSVGSGGEW
jgi:hypothetical protein